MSWKLPYRWVEGDRPFVIWPAFLAFVAFVAELWTLIGEGLWYLWTGHFSGTILAVACAFAAGFGSAILVHGRNLPIDEIRAGMKLANYPARPTPTSLPYVWIKDGRRHIIWPAFAAFVMLSLATVGLSTAALTLMNGPLKPQSIGIGLAVGLIIPAFALIATLTIPLDRLRAKLRYHGAEPKGLDPDAF